MPPALALTAPAVLVIDDEPVIRDTLCEFLQQEGYSVAGCGTGEEAVARATAGKFDLALCDLHLPGIDGLQVLASLRASCPDTLVILITAYGTVETAVEAFQKGASDYLIKPILLHEVHEKIRRLLAQRELTRENQWLRRELHRDAENGEMVVGRSPAMRAVMDLARRVAPSPSTVLILGESGTGKELMARAVHRFAQSAKPTDGRFVAVNCAAIPGELLENQLFGHRRGAYTGADRDTAGVFVHAGAGTVFLDEIGELPLATQAKLLRAIEQKEVMPVGANEPVRVLARILAATNKDLAKEVAGGRFRQDLFFRLNVVAITLPPLRDRRDDLPELVEALLTKHAKAAGKKFTGLSQDAIRRIQSYAWPGNIRELDNAVQRAVILGEPPTVEAADLPPDLFATPLALDPAAVDDLSEAVKRFEKRHIGQILAETPDKREAARRLKIGLSSLYRKIEQYDIAGG
jgi:DNA-binding NtrC family response regulator